MFLQKIELENLLSFKHLELELRPLNVLIGANATGKSNLIRALGLIRSLPRDLGSEIANGGGPRGWINQRTSGPARINLILGAFLYSIIFREAGQSFEISRETDELIREDKPPLLLFERNDGLLRLGPITEYDDHRFSSPRSVLAEVRHPDRPQIAKLANAIEGIRFFREFRTGPGTSARNGIASSALADFLQEDGGNLALVLNEIDLRGGLSPVNGWLSKFFELFAEVKILTRGGITQLYVREKGVAEPLSAISLSDGTLRLLCLLAVLLHPTPPPLICIEEPEVGLHPDAVRMVADLLIEASNRTQLIVTTHSPALIDALTEDPESVVVCDRDFDGFTQMKRLKSADLELWLERYTLGKLWTKGEIGGNRW